MRLRALRLHGFKSFADSTSLVFRDGLTVIVGSNGCGKSNIADAIRWVLGEQRASAIRGAKMEEVIFQGTTRRRPLHYAEVSLHFDNADGSVGVPQSEIEVARKVFREGGSEYSLNRQSCRLRDIHNLLRGTGLGSNAYAVIEAGMIETLLSDRAEERRLLFEEAAGIGRYKDSRQAALRRLESAEGDLSRLNDLVAEVESKVRSLSRQRRRAERYSQLRDRRATLEVWLAEAEALALRSRLEQLQEAHAAAREAERTAAAERQEAERQLADGRSRLNALGEQRGIAAAALEELRAQLESRERESLIATERASHAELRLEQLSRERVEVQHAEAATAAEAERQGAELHRRQSLLEELRRRHEERAERGELLRSAVREEREAAERNAQRSRELARQISRIDGERGSLARRLEDIEGRIAAAEADLARADAEHAARGDEMELALEVESRSRSRFEAAREEVELAREEVHMLRAREKAAREQVASAEARLSRLSAQIEAREAVERAYEEFAPAVAALMKSSSRVGGVLGPLADFLEGVDDPRAVDRYLGGLLQAVVVADLHAAREVRDWFQREWTGGGSLLLLPLDALPGARGPAAWADVLLDELVVVSGDPLGAHAPGRARVGPGGEVVDPRGVIRLTDPRSAPGLLDRREELARMRRERALLAADLQAAVNVRESCTSAVREGEDRAISREEAFRSAEAELRRAQADAAAARQLLERLRDEQARAGDSLRNARDSRAAATSRLEECSAEHEALERSLAETLAEEEAVRARLSELESRWEDIREEEAELRIALARAEADVREAQRRLASAEQAGVASATRLANIEREAGELRHALEGLAGIRELSRSAIASLAAGRDQASERLGALEAEFAGTDASLAELSQAAESARTRESAAGEERHRLELEISELRSRVDRVIDRVEVEWGRPFDVLRSGVEAPDDRAPDEWRRELGDVVAQLEALGTVNLLAVEEHAEEEQRLNFLLEQRKDLVQARDDLTAAIRQINRTAREVFLSTFETVRTNFHRVFQSLFHGGACDIWLAEPESPLESPVEIQASPKGKRTQRIHLLSGGERTLTALALLFALYLVKPAPFCVLDEVDAPLDESNVRRFIQLLQDFKSETQFVVITHNPTTMEAADWVYGVTMEEPGISSVVGVELLGAWEREGQVA